MEIPMGEIPVATGAQGGAFQSVIFLEIYCEYKQFYNLFHRVRQLNAQQRLPCSQLRIVSRETSIRSANSTWLNPSRLRTLRANLAESSIALASSSAWWLAMSLLSSYCTRSPLTTPAEGH